ncbi:hypothetical protein BDW60DRAFT_204369 [Aspergillus nidulans var. acristatus]
MLASSRSRAGAATPYTAFGISPGPPASHFASFTALDERFLYAPQVSEEVGRASTSDGTEPASIIGTNKRWRDNPTSCILRTPVEAATVCPMTEG